jgi:hypothetical protein
MLAVAVGPGVVAAAMTAGRTGALGATTLNTAARPSKTDIRTFKCYYCLLFDFIIKFVVKFVESEKKLDL